MKNIILKEYLKEAKILLILVFPVILAQISQTAMAFVDTIMSGYVSATDMAAIGLGTSIWLPAILFGHGLLLELTPIVSQLNGSGKKQKINYQIYQGLWLAFFISIFIMLLLYKSDFIINNINNININLSKKSITFLRFLLFGAPGYLFFHVIKSKCEGLSKTKPTMIIGFIGLIIKIPINYIFIFGKFGIPSLGGVGCGIASALVYWIMFFIMYTYINLSNEFNKNKFKLFPDFLKLKNLCIIGLPVAMSIFFEVTFFSIVAILIAPMGIIAIASHQIAINFSSLIFILPLSLSIAVTIRIGYNLGKKNVKKALISSRVGLIIGIIFSITTAIITILLRKKFTLLYNKIPAVTTMASHLIFLVSIYQISDSIQVIGNGILRGYKDTKYIFLITFISYWLIGLPLGYLLAKTNLLFTAMGTSGFWIGFIIGFTFSAILIIYRIYLLQKKSNKIILQRSLR